MSLNKLIQSTMQAVTEVANAITPSQQKNYCIVTGPILNACRQDRHEPDLALNLEICDLINRKGRTVFIARNLFAFSCPREAAMQIVKLINHRNNHVAHLALELLDVCVKNCGFPFHLQIATKEFLNELVKRFPERPPALPSPRHLRILEFIQSWHETIANDPKFKNEFQFISKMRHLLSTKGYRFPGIDQEVIRVMTPKETLRSATEIEEEDFMIKKAKLQELLRRGGPAELAEANVLMKELSGYEANVDYKQLEQTNVANVQSKVLHLEAMLHSCTTPYELQLGEIPALYQLCISAHSKIAKLIDTKEEDDNFHAILQLNDALVRVLSLYHQKQQGTPSVAQPPPPPPPSATTLAAPTFGDLLSLSPPSPSATVSVPPHLPTCLYLHRGAWHVSVLWTPPTTVVCQLQNMTHNAVPGPWTVVFGTVFSGTVHQLLPLESKAVTFHVAGEGAVAYHLTFQSVVVQQGQCVLHSSTSEEGSGNHRVGGGGGGVTGQTVLLL